MNTKSRIKTSTVAAVIAGALLWTGNAAAVTMTDPTGGGQSHTNIEPSLAVNFLVNTSGQFPSRTGGSPSTGGTLGDIIMFGGNFAPRGYMEANGQLLQISQNTALFSVLGTTYGGDGRTTFALPDLRGRTPIGSGQGPGLPSYLLGQRLGTDTETLTTGQLPSHNHGLSPSADTTGNAGGSQPHNNMQPSLALNYTQRLQGTFPSRSVGGSAANDMLGMVGLTARNFSNGNEAIAQGQILPINLNTALFSILGTNYGGDGRTSFGLPDLRGRSAIGAGHGPGLTNRLLGSKGGQDDIQLNTTQLPSHNHGIPAGGTTDNTGGGAAHDNMQPYQALNYMIATTGIFPSRGPGGSASNLGLPFLGEIAMFAGNFAPTGWALAAGQLLPIAQNSALFSLLGTTFGGDGRTTFALPDLRGRTPVHYGSGPGLQTWALGARQGVEAVTLTTGQIASHQHTLPDPPNNVPVPAIPALLLIGGLGLLGASRRKH